MQQSCTAFEGSSRIASGALADVALRAKEVVDRGEQGPVLVFDNATGQLVELDLRGTKDDVLRRLTPPEPPKGPGRPKLGVVAREVTLLPRHWEWLNGQPGGASVALRKLVEDARRANEGKDRLRAAQEAAYRFMRTMAGNEPGYEEALRSLFAGDDARFRQYTEAWPADVRDHARELAASAFSAER